MSKFGSKIQNCSKWNLIERLIQICKIQWWCLFYCFRLEIATFFEQMLCLRIVHFFCFWPEVTFFSEICCTIRIVSWIWNLGLTLIRICRTHWSFLFVCLLLLFFFFDWKYPLCVNLVKKFKRVCLRRNLVPILIEICKILW